MIVKFGEFGWHMVVDLKVLFECAGKRVKDCVYGGYYTDYPMNNAKKLLKLLCTHSDEEVLHDMDSWVEENKFLNTKLAEYWKGLRHE